MRFNTIEHSDALEFCRTLPVHSVNAIISDPPFGTKTKHWDNAISSSIFAEFTRICPIGPIALFGYLEQILDWSPYLSPLRIIGHIVWYKPNEIIPTQGLTRTHQEIVIWGRSRSQIRADNVREKYRHINGSTKFSGAHGKNARMIGNFIPSPEGRRATDLWEINVPFHGFNSHLRVHPNQKPEELLRRLVLLLSNPSDVILDPFCGSGTTCLASLNLGRNFLACDIEGEYVEVAKRRLKNSDPYQESTLDENHKQLSLFDGSSPDDVVK